MSTNTQHDTTQPDLFRLAPQYGFNGFPAWFKTEHNPGRYGISREAWDEFEDWRSTKHGAEVVALFVKLSRGMKARGWANYGAMDIIGRIRWHHALKYGPDPEGDGFKINNNWRKRLSVYAMVTNAELAGFFRLRAS